MTRRLRLAVPALAAALAACGSTTVTAPGLHLSEPSAVAAFSGLTPAYAAVHTYLAIANSATNELTILDALNDQMVPAPVPLRPLVVPVPGRPALLAAAPLGDGGPDLLVAVSAGGSELQVVRTWNAGGGIAGTVEMGADVLALTRLPAPPGEARVAAALSGKQVAVAVFRRAAPGETAIDVAGAAVSATGALAFQPVALAAIPGDATRLWAATPDLDGVAQLALDGAGAPSWAGTVLDALAPTRLVAAVRLAERRDGSAIEYASGGQPAPVTAFDGQPLVDRVYAVLDESGCGPRAAIGCGLVALDPATGALALDPSPAGTMHAPFRAPLPFPGHVLALGATPPPEIPPSAAEPVYAGTYMRLASALGIRATTGAAAAASSDGALYYVDLGRWEIPSEQVVHQNVGATVSAARAPAGAGAPVDQWLVLDPAGAATMVSHGDAAGLAAAVTVTPGYTQTDRWTVTHEGVLPGLSSRRAQAGNDGAPWLALQTGSAGAFAEVVHLHDPTLGVRAGDTVVVEMVPPATLAGCASPFEVSVGDFVQPISSATAPGGAVRLVEKDPANAAWHACFAALTGSVTALRATFRAGGADPYLLVRGKDTAAVQAGRPRLGEEFRVEWADEGSFGACTLPPLLPWPANPDGTSCDAGCRTACEGLARARLARRIGYVPEAGVTDVHGPALAFTLALETGAAPPRDLALVLDTRDGRAPVRAVDSLGAGTDPRAVVPFDRSPVVAAEGVGFLVPFASGSVLHASPTNRSVSVLR